jgi:hypothetical protein
MCAEALPSVSCSSFIKKHLQALTEIAECVRALGPAAGAPGNPKMDALIKKHLQALTEIAECVRAEAEEGSSKPNFCCPLLTKPLCY